jgi:hypothetical protein
MTFEIVLCTVTAKSFCKLSEICLKRVASFRMLLHFYATMLTNRKVLGLISGNIQKRKELNPYQRGKIIAAAVLGLLSTAIAKAYPLGCNLILVVVQKILLVRKWQHRHLYT